MKPSDLTFKFINHVVDNNFIDILETIYVTSIKFDDTDKIKYIIRRSDNIKRLLLPIIYLYGRSQGSSVFKRNMVKEMLFITLSKIEDLSRLKFSLGDVDIQDLLNDITDIISGFQYALYSLYDLIAYIIFRMINDVVLKEATIRQLEMMLGVLISVNSPQILIETILKYLPPESKYSSDEFRKTIFKRTKPNGYHSLFEEDI